MRLHPKGARPGSHFLLLKDGLSLSRISEVPLCSPLSVFWVCVVCSLHPRMMDPRDNTCNFNGRGGYSLGSSAGTGSWKCWPEASVTGFGTCRDGGSTTSGRAGKGAVAAAGLHLALDWALRRPPVLVEHWEAGPPLSSMGEGSGHPRPNL